MAFPLCVSAYAETYYDHYTAYAWAIEAGFPEAFLQTIDDDFLRKIYFDNKDAEQLEVDADVTYYSELSEDGIVPICGNN